MYNLLNIKSFRFLLFNVVWAGFLSFTQNIFAQTPIDGTHGIDFGTGDDDPAMGKNSTTDDLDLGLSHGRAFKIYSGGDALPYTKIGQGNAGSVTAGKWYRVAKATVALRANAQFILMDNINGGGHSSAVFRVGMSYNDPTSMGFALLSHTYYGPVTFSQIRVLRKSTYDPMYIEVKVNRSGPVRYSIEDNLASGGWIPVDWEQTLTIPTGYTEHVYNINKLFVVGKTESVFSIGYNNTVDVNGELNVLGSPVLTQSSASSLLGGRYVELSSNNTGSESSLLLDGEYGGMGEIPVEGDGTRMMWYPEKSAFRVGRVGGPEGHDDWNDVNIGDYSVAMGRDVRASGLNSVALGFGADALGDYSAAMGLQTSSKSLASFVTGFLNEGRGGAGGKTSWQGDDQHSVLEVGIGGNGEPKNALTVLQDGSIELGKATAADNSIPLHIKADGSVILSKAQGDISMGVFGN